MSEDRQGLFWHVHHGKLLEWCYSYNERAEFIRTEKHKDEQETRLRLFQPVRGDLPQEVVKAECTLIEAERAYSEARRVYNRAYDKAGRALDKAGRALSEARFAYDKALKRNMPAIEALHKIECPDCPWDGYTIFPNA